MAKGRLRAKGEGVREQGRNTEEQLHRSVK